MQYQAYPIYENSSLEWIDSLPEHWQEIKLKFICQFGTGWTPPTKVEKYFHGENLWATIGDMEERYIEKTALHISDEAVKEFNMFQVQEGSLLYSFKLSVGKVAFVAKPMYTNEAIFFVLPSESFSIKFLYYLFPVAIIQNANENIYGAKILNQDRIKNAFLSIPPLDEQEKISDFLDYKTQQIDQLIEKKKSLIEKLEEKRIAVITQAVTKGLDRKSKLKPSGVDWLGDMPRHWECGSLKFFSNTFDCKHLTAEFTDDGYPLASISEVKGWAVDLTTSKNTTFEYYIDLIGGGRKPEAGDIIYSRNATVGEAAIVLPGMPDFAMGQDVCLIRCLEVLSPNFLMYVLNSKLVLQQLDLLMVGSTFKRINVDDIRNYIIALPSLDEQKDIVKYLDAEVERINNMLSKADEVVGKLIEYRSSIITSAVTGKIDVREVDIPKEAA